MIKKILLLVCYAQLALSGSSREYIALRIKAIRNCSEKRVSLDQEAVSIEAYAKKLYLLKENVDIPFISISEYPREYAQGVQGKAYIPKGALLITLENRKFGFWENENGIWCSPEPKSGADEEQWPAKLTNNVNKRKPKEPKLAKSILKFLLVIDKASNISLEDYNSFVPLARKNSGN